MELNFLFASIGFALFRTHIAGTDNDSSFVAGFVDKKYGEILSLPDWILLLVILKSPSALWEKAAHEFDGMLNHGTIFDQ
jgi:hypothetical protein